jgi:hypothetical protein
MDRHITAAARASAVSFGWGTREPIAVTLKPTVTDPKKTHDTSRSRHCGLGPTRSRWSDVKATCELHGSHTRMSLVGQW